MASQEKAQKLLKKAEKLTKLTFTRWSADWASATPLYEEAALGFKLAKMPEQAKDAYERASVCQERLSLPWQAAKHLEAAGALAKEIGRWDEVADFYRRACELYVESGKPQLGADALAKGARALEDAKPDEASQMLTDSIGMMEDEGKEQMAFETYRAATALYIKRESYMDAASMLLRWGLAADKGKSTQTQCKAYLSAIIVYLYGNDLKEADQCYNDCSGIDAFLNSDQGSCAERLLRAYREGDAEEIKRIMKSSNVIPHLDHVIVRLAKQLPTSDLMNVAGETALDDEDDLT